MSFVLSVYGDRAFKKILLPAVNNADYKVILYKDIFELEADISLLLEIVDYKWRFKPNNRFTLIKAEENYFGNTLRNNDVLQLRTREGERLSILIYEIKNPFEVFKKYSLKNLKKVTIGQGKENHIQYDYMGLISKNHAVFETSERGWVIQDFSTNGIFVNGAKVFGEYKLNFGDSVQIFGLQIIFLENILAIGQAFSKIIIDHEVLYELNGNRLETFSKKYDEEIPEKNYFHRTPRNIEKVDTEAIEIEGPPSPVRSRKQSMLMSVGPAFSMAVPMILGGSLSILGSNTSSLFMYAGMATAVSSALIGSVWAAANVKTAKKEALKDEEERKNAYVNYLKKTMACVKEKYDKNTNILNIRYPSVKICTEYGCHSAALWNRNHHHEDFLFHRIGLGRMPFQAPIFIPKDQFRVQKDELALKPKDIKAAYETLKDIPVGVDFLKHSLIGIVGGKNKKGALEVARDLLIQIAANNCYTDVKTVIVYNKENSYEEEYLRCARWLPHVWSEDKKTRYTADTMSAATNIFYELAKIFRKRDEQSSEDEKCILKPYYILFVADSSYLEGEVISKYIFANKKKYGLSTVFLTESYEELPNACEYIIQNNEEFQGYFNVTDNVSDRVPVNIDKIEQKEFEMFTRRLSNIEVNEVERGGEIPNTLSFFEMMGIQELAQLNVLTRWKKNRTYDSMKAIVGQKSGGIPCYLDIHEKYHGPHGLVAGTTGSGKSETLQTYILSLAINYSPDDVGFFVIDYKGGGMANLFSNLPHTIGQISNLSGNQVHRAMVSIKSENRRRQVIFNENGVNNINNYTRLYKNNEASVPIPHLFIIIDEFAELKREEPDFMRELISVAQVGRSLGVHLILATQKPSGTVDDNIWSNTKFRLCLRVQDRQDSVDMLHKPDAAYITQAGRCYLQVGNDEIYELFQSGWSGAIYDENAGNFRTEIARMYSCEGKAALVGNRMKTRQKEEKKKNWILTIVNSIYQLINGDESYLYQIQNDVLSLNTFMERVFEKIENEKLDYPRNEYNMRRMEELLQLYAQACRNELLYPETITDYIINQATVQGKKIPEIKEKTQLDAIVEYLSILAEKSGYTNQFKLWMPVLPEKLYLSELKGYKQNSFDKENWPQYKGKWKLEAYMGMIDDPVNQAQIPLIINLSEGGHHAICGTVVTGKSTFLQTFIYSMTHSYSPDYINFYLLDFSSHMLGAFENLAHIGGILYENDLEKLGKFFNLMDEIMKERKELLRGGNYEQYVNAHGVVIPAIVIVIDQFSNFQEKTGGIYGDALIQLSRNGAGYGIYLVITSAGFGINEIPNRIGDNIRTVLCLEMSDKFQYSDVLHMLHIEVYPESGIKGRGLINHNGNILEFQTALSVQAKDDYLRTQKIVEECEIMNSRWKGRKARSIPNIPESPILSQFLELESVQKNINDPYHLPLGYNQENASVYSIDLRKIFCWIVQGKAKTGKTNVLRILMQMALRKGGNVAVTDFSGMLKSFSQKAGVRVLDNFEDVIKYWTELLPVIQKRNMIKKDAVENEMDEKEIYKIMSKEESYYFFVDDLGEFVKQVYSHTDPRENIQGFLENITDKGNLFNIYIIAAYNHEKNLDVTGFGIFENIVRYKTGIHLGGNVVSQRIMDFEYIPFTEQSRTYKPGIGLLPAVEGEVETKTVVLPLDRKKHD